MKYLIDSDAVIGYLHEIPSTLALIRPIVERGDDLCLCEVVVAEVYSGLAPQDAARAELLMGACYFLPSTYELARQAGEWRYRYARRGRALSTTDVLIAATAAANSAAVLTANTSHFPMPEVEVLELPRVRL